MHLFQLEIITINFHAFYITKNGTLLCDVTMTLIRQEKIGNIIFLKQHTCFLKKMNINHIYPKMHTAAQISTKRPALYCKVDYKVFIIRNNKLIYLSRMKSCLWGWSCYHYSLAQRPISHRIHMFLATLWVICKCGILGIGCVSI